MSGAADAFSFLHTIGDDVYQIAVTNDGWWSAERDGTTKWMGTFTREQKDAIGKAVREKIIQAKERDLG